MALCAAAAVALGCADEQPRGQSDGEAEQVTDSVRAITRTDPRTHLRFEVQTNTMFGDSSLHVAFSATTPASIREQLQGADVMPGCDVPGAIVRGFPQHWGRQDEIATALLVEPVVPVADRATRCWLEIGQPGPRPGTIVLTGDVVAAVRLRSSERPRNWSTRRVSRTPRRRAHG
jgi:hypothetical protein